MRRWRGCAPPSRRRSEGGAAAAAPSRPLAPPAFLLRPQPSRASVPGFLKRLEGFLFGPQLYIMITHRSPGLRTDPNMSTPRARRLLSVLTGLPSSHKRHPALPSILPSPPPFPHPLHPPPPILVTLPSLFHRHFPLKEGATSTKLLATHL